MEKYKVGDVLRVKTWEEMTREYGSPSRVPFTFTESMRYLCGKRFVVKEIDYNGRYHSVDGDEDDWSISAQMLTPYKDMCAPSFEDLKSLLGVSL